MPSRNVQTKRSKPNRILEAKVSLRRQAHAQILSAHPIANHARSRGNMPGSSTHIRSHKQAHSRKLAKQQREYPESMASSTIFKSLVLGEAKGSCLYKFSFSSQMLLSADYTFIPKSGTRSNFIILALLFLLFLYAFFEYLCPLLRIYLLRNLGLVEEVRPNRFATSLVFIFPIILAVAIRNNQ